MLNHRRDLDEAHVIKVNLFVSNVFASTVQLRTYAVAAKS